MRYLGDKDSAQVTRKDIKWQYANVGCVSSSAGLLEDAAEAGASLLGASLLGGAWQLPGYHFHLKTAPNPARFCSRRTSVLGSAPEPPPSLSAHHPTSHRPREFCCLKTWDEALWGNPERGQRGSIGGVLPSQTAAARAALSSKHGHHLSHYSRQPLTTPPQREYKQLLASFPAY